MKHFLSLFIGIFAGVAGTRLYHQQKTLNYSKAIAVIHPTKNVNVNSVERFGDSSRCVWSCSPKVSVTRRYAPAGSRTLRVLGPRRTLKKAALPPLPNISTT